MNACWQHKIVNLYLDQEGWPNQFQALQQSSPVETINYFSLQVAYSIHYEKWNFFSVWTIFWGVYAAVVYCWTAVSLSVWLILAFEVNWIGRNRSRLLVRAHGSNVGREGGREGEQEPPPPFFVRLLLLKLLRLSSKAAYSTYRSTIVLGFSFSFFFMKLEKKGDSLCNIEYVILTWYYKM